MHVQLRQRIRPWMFVSAVWIGPAALAVVQTIGQRRLDGDPPATARDLLWGAGDWLLYAAVTPAILWISHRWPIIRGKLASRLAIHLSFALLFCVVWAVGGKILQLVLAATLDGERLRAAIAAAGGHLSRDVAIGVASWILTTLPFGVVVYTTVAGLAHAMTYFVAARDRDLQVARLAEQLASARYAALQAQVNPHFLFNTLNTIAVFVRDGDRQGAVQIVEHLSDVLRQTLSRHRANEVTVEAELALIRQYLAIEQARFPDRLAVEIKADESVNAAAVPSFALQHLVENAIRHGIARKEGEGRVRIDVTRDGSTLVLTVADDGPGMSAAPSGSGHGLDNTRARLAALYGGHASLELSSAAGGGTAATLRLPYRDIAMETSVDED